MITEVIGVIGGLFIFLAFIYVASGKWNGNSFWYEAFNLIGGILLSYYAIQKRVYTNIVLNIIWIVVASYSIMHIIERHRHRKAKKKSKKRKSIYQK